MEKITSTHDEWDCTCGNNAFVSGFFPCNEQGIEIEPTIENGWTNLFVCADCGRIINQDTLEVVGTRK